MNFKWDLKIEKDQRKKEEAAKAQLRKRSMESIARPKAKKNLFSNDPRMQGI